MDNLDVEKFNPTKAELTTIADKYKSLKINGVEDFEGYKKVDVARKELKVTLSDIKKFGKKLREKALQYQRGVIKEEKELIAIIEPIKIELEEKQKKIDDKKKSLQLQQLLPIRKNKLEEIEVMIEDKEINLMDEAQFSLFYNEKKEIYLEEKALKIKEAEKKLEQEKRDKQLKEEAEKKAREEAIEQAKLDKLNAEQEKEDAIQAEKDKAQEAIDEKIKEAEKQKVLVAQEKQEAIEKAEQEKQDLIDAQIAKEKKAEEDKIAEEKAKEEKAKEIERQKQLAPDKEKLVDLANQITGLILPRVKSEKSIEIVRLSAKKLSAIAKEIVNESNKL